jgi:peptide methionine sulfoxide reductase MsrB
MPQLHTRSGNLSAYGYACGYSTAEKKDEGVWKYICKEHNVYHVRWKINEQKGWESFHTLKEATDYFKSITL